MSRSVAVAEQQELYERLVAEHGTPLLVYDPLRG